MKPYEIKLIKTCKSTNDYLIEDALQGAQEGKSIISLKQTKGRGTKNNCWISDYGNIFLSTLLRPKGSKKYWPQLSLLAGLSVFETLLEIGVNRKDIKIKWPNDILLNFKKVSGILVESIDNFAVIGIGLNLKSSPKFVTGEFKATNLSRKILEESDEEWDRIMKLTGANNKKMLVTIRESFRKGIPKSEIEILNMNITKAYDILKDIGGKRLVGEGESLAEGTIWNAK